MESIVNELEYLNDLLNIDVNFILFDCKDFRSCAWNAIFKGNFQLMKKKHT